MSDKKALGRGLAALIPPKAGTKQAERQTAGILKETGPGKWLYKGKEVIYLDVDKISPNRWQPRSNFNDDKLKELMDSIRQKGVIQPILVRQLDSENFELLAGERRWRAVKALRIDSIPAILKDAKDDDALQISLIENLQRDDLNPLEEAQAFKQLMDNFNLDYEAIARLIGKDHSTVSNTVRLLTLSKKVQDALMAGLITMGHAKAILSLKDPAAQDRLCKKIVDRKLSVREAERLASVKKPAVTARDTQAAKKDPQVLAVEEKLQRALGTKVRLLPAKRGGRLMIEYFSDNDLLRIIDILISHS